MNHYSEAEVKKFEEERWIALDHASPDDINKVVEEMVRYALSLEVMENVWSPARMTSRFIKEGKPINIKDVFMWVGTVPHNAYGSDFPCVKSRGLVNMAPKHLAELLLDSNQVKSYNKHSQGRADAAVWQRGLDTENGLFGRGETKVTHSINKAPMVLMVRKPLEVICLLHGRRLEGGGFMVVARTVSGHVASGGKKPTVLNEVLLNVHILYPVKGSPNQTDMVNINHLKSPLVPAMVAKKVGLVSATCFMNDIRSLK